MLSAVSPTPAQPTVEPRAAAGSGVPEPPLLAVEDLTLAFPGTGGWHPVIRGLSFEVAAGELVGLVGESGSGKSLTALAIMGLVPSPGRILAGSLRFRGQELLGLPEARRRKYRGRSSGGHRLPGAHDRPEPGAHHRHPDRRGGAPAPQPETRPGARREAARLLDLVAIPDARERLKDYPHQLSGGQRQRAMIAIGPGRGAGAAAGGRAHHGPWT